MSKTHRKTKQTKKTTFLKEFGPPTSGREPDSLKKIVFCFCLFSMVFDTFDPERVGSDGFVGPATTAPGQVVSLNPARVRGRRVSYLSVYRR